MANEIKKIQWGQLLIQLAIPLAVGGLGAIITNIGMEEFEQLRKPPLSPPQLVFPIVWTILYLLMGVSLYLTMMAHPQEKEKKEAYWLYGVQLALNLLWTVLYFALGMRMVAFFVLLTLLAVSWIMAAKMARLRPVAGRLQIPYLIWLVFAGYLNMGVYLLN